MVDSYLVLYLTTAAAVGALTVWAAVSRRHWLMRTLVLIGVAALTLLAPASELFVGLLALEGVVFLGVKGWRRLRRRRDQAEGAATRFSVRDALLAVIPVALVCVALVRMPPLGANVWFGCLTAGAMAGSIFLLAAWIVAGVRWKWWARAPIAVAAGVAALSGASAWARLLTSLSYQAAWPEVSLVNRENRLTAIEQAWPALLVGAIAAAACLAWAARPVIESRRWWRGLILTSYLLLGLLVFAPPALMLYLLATPPGFDPQAVPNPNGIDDYHRAIDLLAQPLNVEPDDAADAGIAGAEEIEETNRRAREAAAIVELGLAHGVSLTYAYTNDPMGAHFEQHLDRIGYFKSLGQTVGGVANSLRFEGRLAEAARTYTLQAQYGASLTQGGLLVDTQVAAVVIGLAGQGLYAMRSEAPPTQLREVIDGLVEAERLLASPDDILRREQIASRNRQGWTARAIWTLDDEGLVTQSVTELLATTQKRPVATLRLLQIELALQSFHDQHGAWPAELSELTPGVLDELPTDPFAEGSSPFQYHRTDDGYTLYSVWADGADDQGTPPRNAGGAIEWDASLPGDLSLEAHYTPQPVAASDDSDIDDNRE